jgi:hypothetical protein
MDVFRSIMDGFRSIKNEFASYIKRCEDAAFLALAAGPGTYNDGVWATEHITSTFNKIHAILWSQSLSPTERRSAALALLRTLSLVPERNLDLYPAPAPRDCMCLITAEPYERNFDRLLARDNKTLSTAKSSSYICIPVGVVACLITGQQQPAVGRFTWSFIPGGLLSSVSFLQRLSILYRHY